MATFTPTGNASLRYAGTERIRTTNSGVAVTGTISLSGMGAGEQALSITSPRNDAITNGLAYINITDSNAPFDGLKILSLIHI